MSAFGPKRTLTIALHMSAFGGKADMTVCGNPVGIGGKADIALCLLSKCLWLLRVAAPH